MKTDKEAGKSGEGGSRSNYSELPENEDSSPSKVITKKDSRKSNKENREIRILRRNKTLKEKCDPDRFSGEGINFKAKIIGTEHVFDARGNRMCQGALQRLKAAIKTSGDHKQRIILNISYSGIIIKDEKTGEILHHHPIHKISFISQDTVDKRSFGYVFGCPQTGHEFFGIKTEKIASHVVLTLRDLFLAALEIKKKEIENAKDAQKESETPTVHENGNSKVSTNGISDVSTNGAVNVGGAARHDRQTLHDELLYSNTVLLPDESVIQNDENTHSTEPAIDSLLDLQFTMDSLQMGISQMDHTIATAASQGFGLSFSEDDISECSSSSLPMSFHFKMDKFSSLYQETLSISSRSSSTSDYNVCVSENRVEDSEPLKKDFNLPSTPLDYRTNALPSSSTDVSQNTCSSPTETTMPPIPTLPSPSEKKPTSNALAAAAALIEANSKPVEDRYAVFLDIDALPSIFDNPVIVQSSNIKEESTIFSEELAEDCNKQPMDMLQEIKTSTPIVFAELDPLGNQPYVDKRDFFQDIKNPPKKVLKDLAGGVESFSDSIDIINSSAEDFPVPGGISAELFQSSAEWTPAFSTSCDSDQRQINPFATSQSALPRTPPKLPPKRSMSVAAPFSHIPEDPSDPAVVDEDQKWEVKNPFNPFVEDDFPDFPPPSSPPPPPPPPRLPVKAFEVPPVISPPPPRPPSRSNGIPTPPLPKRKPLLASSANTWFSFDQEALNFPPAPSTPNPEPTLDPYLPPIPSPARKFPPCKVETSAIKSASPSNSPATIRRLSIQGGSLSNSAIKESDIKLNSSPRKVLSRHSSLLLENDAFSSSANLFSDTRHVVESSILEEVGAEGLDSPPLPPKPLSIARPRPSPSKKMLSSVHSSSLSGSNASAVESSNGTHSSSSLVFSSSDDGKLGSSAEALFVRSSESHTEVFSQNGSEASIELSSTSEPTKEPCELSPDSIFRRKSDPFADDFFLSLPKKSACKNKENDVERLPKKTCSNGVDLHFENVEATI